MRSKTQNPPVPYAKKQEALLGKLLRQNLLKRKVQQKARSEETLSDIDRPGEGALL